MKADNPSSYAVRLCRHATLTGPPLSTVICAPTCSDGGVEGRGDVAQPDPRPTERDQPRFDVVRWHVLGNVRRRKHGQGRTKAVAGDQDLIAACGRGGQ